MIAVIETGSKQYIVEKGQSFEAELLSNEEKIEFKPLLLIDGDDVLVGKPMLENATVVAKVSAEPVKGDKIQVLKYKAKKRQSTRTGHRQSYSVLTVTEIKKSA